MGWFGLCVDYENKTFTRFSSPAWGWVGSECREDDESFKKFLSPLGDGLVLNLLAFTPVKMRFSSPLGDGLVQEYGSARWGNTKEFSSPSGDGLVPLDLLKRFTTKNYFRPRLGMGWFLIYCFRTNCTQIFK